MRAILEFNLPDDEAAFALALKAPRLAGALSDAHNELRHHIKYDSDPSPEASRARDRLIEILAENDLTLDDL